jgi:hypothetical protein
MDNFSKLEIPMEKDEVVFDSINLEKTKEYAETQFLFSESVTSYNNEFKLFAAEVLEYYLKNKSLVGFSSTLVGVKCGLFEFIISLCLIDLPFTHEQHTFDRKDISSLSILAQSNFVIFTKQIAEAMKSTERPVLSIEQYLTTYPNNQPVKTVLKNQIYVHETIITNISSSVKNFEILIQVPLGYIPVKQSEYITTKNESLNRFTTKSILTSIRVIGATIAGDKPKDRSTAFLFRVTAKPRSATSTIR